MEATKSRVDAAMEDVLMSEVKLRADRREQEPSTAKGAVNTKEERQLKSVVPETKKATLCRGTSKKRRRRSAAEIDRKYKCSFAGCLKAYGSEGSLIHHQKLKHPKKANPLEKEGQVNTASSWPYHNTSRNVTIRPATTVTRSFTADPKLLLSDQSAKAFNNTSLDLATPPDAKASRRSMRSRSNSEPVAFFEEKAKSAMKARSQSLRKLRRGTTPGATKLAMNATTPKGCSSSNSFPAPKDLEPLDKFQMPASCRRDSSIPDMGLSISSPGGTKQESLEWAASLTSASGHPTSDQQAIDNDILSVLANCDVEDAGPPSAVDFVPAPSSTSSYLSNTSLSAMDCFKMADNVPLSTRAQQGAELTSKTPFPTLDNDWTNALLLSNHLEKMTMVQSETPGHGLVVPTFDTDAVDRLLLTSHPVDSAAQIQPELIHFSTMPLQVSSPVKTPCQLQGEFGLLGQPTTSSSTLQPWLNSSVVSEPAKIQDGNSSQTLSRSTGETLDSNPQPSSEALDALLQHDDTDEWKLGDVYNKRDAEIAHPLRDTAALIS